MKKIGFSKINFRILMSVCILSILLFRGCASFDVFPKNYNDLRITVLKKGNAEVELSDSQTEELISTLKTFKANSTSKYPPGTTDNVLPGWNVFILLKYNDGMSDRTRVLYLGIDEEVSYVSGIATLSKYGYIKNGNILYQSVCQIIDL